MKKKLTRSAIPSLLVGITFFAPASAALVIDSITSSNGLPAGTTDLAGTVTSITVDGTTYTDLTAPTSLSGGSGDYIAIGTVPTTVEDALGNLDLDTGALNSDFTVQFGRTVTDDDLFFMLNNNDQPGSPKFNGFRIQAINSGGGSVGSVTTFGNSEGPELVIDRTFNRTGGTTLTSREMYGYSFSLSDLGLAGNTTVTGFTLTDNPSLGGALDPSVVGLASVIPEPSTLSLLGLSGLAWMVIRRRKKL
jgi:hypothetical protein